MSVINSNVTDGNARSRALNNTVKNKNASLICFMPSPMASNMDYKDVTEKLLGKLSVEGIENDVMSSHPLVRAY